MKANVYIAAGAIGLASVLSAQTSILPQPVPTRIETAPYGPKSTAVSLSVLCDLRSDDTDALLVQGGQRGQLGYVMIGTRPAMTWTPWGALLVGEGAVMIPKIFDSQGCFRIPIDAGDPFLAGNTFWVQAGIIADGVDGALSSGLRIRVAPGVLQPPLSYYGPQQEFVLCKEVHPDGTTWGIRAQFLVPSEGWAVEVADVTGHDGATTVELNLWRRPISAGVPGRARKWVDLPQAPGSRVEVWVAIRQEGLPACMALAGVIDTKF